MSRGDGARSRVTRYSRADYVWPYATGPSYGEEPAKLRQRRRSPGLLVTRVGTFDLTRGLPDFPAALTTHDKTDQLDAQYFIVQLDPAAVRGGALGLVRGMIEDNGGAIVRQLPVMALIARVNRAAVAEIETAAGVMAVLPYHAAFKLDPTIGRAPLLDPLAAVSAVYDLQVRLFQGEEAERVARELAQLGGNVTSVVPDTVRVKIHRSKLAEVASLEGVESVHEYVGFVPLGEETTTTVMTGTYNAGAVPYHDAGCDGGGGGWAGPQVLMILDSGIQLDAGDLSHTRIDVGFVGPTHRKVRRYQSTDLFTGARIGRGDMRGCDAPESGGFTHGHLVAATALGNASTVDVTSYGAPWFATDLSGRPWKLDGVAMGAVLVAFDGHRTPAGTSCQDRNAIEPGDLYSGGATGSLGDSWENDLARVANFSWGAPLNSYTPEAHDIDLFLLDKQNALVFVAAGNVGHDSPGTLGNPATTKNGLAIGASRAAGSFGEESKRAYFSSIGPAVGDRVAPQLMAPGDEAAGGTMGLPSEFGCRSNDNDQNNPVQCDIVAGEEGTSYASAAAAGAALLVRDYFAQGFFPDGTTSDTGNDADRVDDVSGALVKAVLIASAEFLTGGSPRPAGGSAPPSHVQLSDCDEFDRQGDSYECPLRDNLSIAYRFNNEQGYGRIKLVNVLPLEIWPAGVSDLLVADERIGGGNIPGLDGMVDVTSMVPDTGTFEVCDDTQELRVALAWFDEPGQALVNDLDLELDSPSGRVYYGNYFTDDDNRDGRIDPSEDCPGLDGTTGTVSSSAWSLPICLRGGSSLPPHDATNPTEAVMLSPDPLGDGNPANGQIESGTWTIRVVGATGSNTMQRYSVAIAGGVCARSSVRLDAADYSCNARPVVSVSDKPEAGDPNPTESDVAGRTTVEVLSGKSVVDRETGLVFARSGSRYDSASLVLTSDTERDPRSGALDVRDGDVIRVTYADVGADGAPDPTRIRTSTASVTCAARLDVGSVVLEQFGRDATYFVAGGCERSARGLFEYGFPDRYMDAGEALVYRFAFASEDPQNLYDVKVGLHCVLADANSPASCRPGSLDCADPDRLDNASCDQVSGCMDPPCSAGDVQLMEILDTPKVVDFVAAGSAVSSGFRVQMSPTINGSPEIEMVLQVEAPTAGKTARAIAVNRHTTNVDEMSFFYSTDFPNGGTEILDVNDRNRGNEIAEDPTTNLGVFAEDYVFETRVWNSMGGVNAGLQAPWNFDVTDGGFRVGLLATTDESTITNLIAQWGEDKNFNDVDDRRCFVDATIPCMRDSDCPSGFCESVEDREPFNSVIDKSWSTRGGCGWQTTAPNTCNGNSTIPCFNDADCGAFAPCSGPAAAGGIWHTGRIGATTSGSCLVTGSTTGQCQSYETVGGTVGLRSWREHLVTPVIQKVNGAAYTVEILNWRWNQAIDLADDNAVFVWEFDTDVDAFEPVDLFADNTVLNLVSGPYGAVADSNNPQLTHGFGMFAPLSADLQASVNGSDFQGNNRQGKNSCFFEGGAVNPGLCPDCPNDPGDLGWAGPLDDDVDDDSDGTIDEYVTPNGPVRNMDIRAANGPDMRFDMLEDLYGDTGQSFRGSLGIWTFEAPAGEPAPAIGYGIGIDDMVVEWREFTLTEDGSTCGTACTLDTSIPCNDDSDCIGNGVCGGECGVVDFLDPPSGKAPSRLTITVLDKTPATPNDCDLDGNPDQTQTTDCDSDGVEDVPVLVSSGEDSEIVYANLDDGSGQGLKASRAGYYRAEIPTSSQADTPGVLFAENLSEVTATYVDNDDGTGKSCANSANPNVRGLVQATIRFTAVTADVRIESITLSDNGDDDGFADTDETVDVQIRVTNHSEMALTNLVARLLTDDPEIDCVVDTSIEVGDLAPGETVTPSGAFRFHVSETADRMSMGLSDLDDLSAEFRVLFSADQVDAAETPQRFTLDLDLDAAGGGAPGTFVESFESGTFGAFTSMNLDAGRHGPAASDGYRCQYSDPDWIGSNAYAGGITDCFLGADTAQADAYFWQVHTPGAIDGGKAYSGANSLYMGVFGPTPDSYTTPLATLEAIRSTAPIHLGSTGTAELSFKTQVAFVDSRTINVPSGETAGRGVVQLQLANPATGVAVGDWITLQPHLNVYDQQGVSSTYACTFDPVDDGNREDDFFDPTDPNRRLGPSSTCSPERAFGHMGDTFLPFSADQLGGADGPGLEGSLGPGTWVEPRFNLGRFRGRSVRLRFLNTDVKVGTRWTWEELLRNNPSSGDDGWWIDDVTVTNAMTTPATVSVDSKILDLPAACDDTCSSVDEVLDADPAGVLPAPGQSVTLSAANSIADRCLDGVLQFRFCIDGSVPPDQSCTHVEDTVLRDWTNDPEILVAPRKTTHYAVDVRCSSDLGGPCDGMAGAAEGGNRVEVRCPSSGTLSYPTVLADSPSLLRFKAPVVYSYVKGPLQSVSHYPVILHEEDLGPASPFYIGGDAPAANEGFYYLFRADDAVFCNVPGTTWGGVARDANVSRETQITSDAHQSRSIAVGDVNGDLIADVVVGNNGRNRLYLGVPGPDPWAAASGIDISSDAVDTRSIALGDVDGDGDMDVVAGNTGVNRVYLNNGSVDPWTGAAFDIVATDDHDTRSVELEDVDGDGDLDLIVANAGNVANRVYLNQCLDTLDCSSGSVNPWTGGMDITGDADDSRDVAVGDVDADGDEDLIVANAFGQTTRVYFNQCVDLANCDGTSTNPWPQANGEDVAAGDTQTASDVVLADVDGDNDLDVVLGVWNQPNRLYLNTGVPWASVSGKNIGADADQTTGVVLMDWNGDTHLDVVVANWAQPNRLYLNNGTSDAWKDVVGAAIGNTQYQTSSAAAADIDGDGKPDSVFFTNWSAVNLRIVPLH